MSMSLSPSAVKSPPPSVDPFTVMLACHRPSDAMDAIACSRQSVTLGVKRPHPHRLVTAKRAAIKKIVFLTLQPSFAVRLLRGKDPPLLQPSPHTLPLCTQAGSLVHKTKLRC